MEATASERLALSRIPRMCVALSNGQCICLATVYEDERYMSIQIVCKLDERPRIGGCIERRGSREAYVDRAGLSSWR